MVTTYDNQNRVTEALETTNGYARSIWYNYDSANRLISYQKGWAREIYQYDSFGRQRYHFTSYRDTTVLTNIYTYETPADDNTTSRVAAFTNRYGGRDVVDRYTYDDNGNILTISDGTYTTSYTYDTANQLTRENNQKAGKTWVWTYDNAGNILSRKEYAYTTGTLGTALDTVSYGYTDSAWGDLLTSYDGQTITSDEIGNMLFDGTWTYTWEHGRELASMSDGSTTWSMTYNADGLRTKRTNGTKTYNYTYYGGQLVHMSVDGSDMYFSTSPDGVPMAVTYQGTQYLYVTNLQGDVTAILDTSGNTVVEYTYDAWGNILTTTGSMASTLGELNPLRYRGYVYDRETGLYYVSSRYYDPEIGRFINADTTDILTATPMGLTDKNLYAYCDNNPVMRADYGGDFWHIVVGAAAGALIGGVVKAVSNAIEGKSLTDGLATAMLAGAASGALASTGVGIVGMVAGNAAISMAENAANQVIENKGFNNFDVGDMLIDGAIGGVSGALGGAGKGTKHLTNLGKQTVKRTFNATTHRGLKAGLKEAGKAFAYYGKNSAKYYKTFVKGLPSDFISTVGTTIASSNYMKYQYRRIFGR